MFHPDYKEERHDGLQHKSTMRVPKSHCYYHGKVRGDEHSLVALSTCDGLHGLIDTKDSRLFIQPAHRLMDDSTDLHILYPSNHVEDKSQCGNHDHDHDSHVHNSRFIQEKAANMPEGGIIQKTVPARAPDGLHRRLLANSTSTTRYIELAVLNDRAFFNKHGVNTEVHAAALVNVVAGLYKHQGVSGPNPFNHLIVVMLKTQRTITGTNPFTIADQNPDADATISSFCNYRKTYYADNDVAHLFSGTSKFCTTAAGLAPCGG
jgi:hypothetical protein